MDIGVIVLLLVIMMILKVFAVRIGAKDIAHAIDYWLTTAYGRKSFEKRAAKRGFLDVYNKELELHSRELITQMQCFNAFRAAERKNIRNMIK